MKEVELQEEKQRSKFGRKFEGLVDDVREVARTAAVDKVGWGEMVGLGVKRGRCRRIQEHYRDMERRNTRFGRGPRQALSAA